MTDKLELSLLGPVAITLDGEPVSGHVPAKSQALLCFLAATGLPHGRERLAGLLWGDNPEAKAKQTGMEIESLWIATDSLVELARLLTTSDPGEAAAEQAVELLAFVLQHPSSRQEAQDRATPLLAELRDRLSPAAVAAAKERGQARDLQTIVEEVQIQQNRI